MNYKQLAKVIIVIIIGSMPFIFSPFIQAKWYYILLAISSFFFIFGLLALFQLIVNTYFYRNRLRKLPKFVIALFLLASFSLTYFWISYHESRPYDLLKNNYEVAEAQLDEQITLGDSISIGYHYQIEGTLYYSQKKVRFVSDPFNIKYLPSNPEINEPIF